MAGQYLTNARATGSFTPAPFLHRAFDEEFLAQVTSRINDEVIIQPTEAGTFLISAFSYEGVMRTTRELYEHQFTALVGGMKTLNRYTAALQGRIEALETRLGAIESRPQPIVQVQTPVSAPASVQIPVSVPAPPQFDDESDTSDESDEEEHLPMRKRSKYRSESQADKCRKIYARSRGAYKLGERCREQAVNHGFCQTHQDERHL